jgi:hypothetical protein
MLLNSRVIFSDNGTLRDLSPALNDAFATSEVLDIVAAQDKLYIGSEFPFNHRYFEIAVANDQASTVSVELWNGTSWVPALDVIDHTKGSNGRSLSQSGIISWVPDRDETWDIADNTYGEVTGLTTLKIYDLYWARLTFSADLKVTTALNYVGHVFSEDKHLGARYPELNTSAVKTAFLSGKTDWAPQHVLAAEEIIAELRHERDIWTRNQLLDAGQFRDAAVHKLAAIIMTAFGDDFAEKRAEAERQAIRALALQVPVVDKDGDARADTEERQQTVGFFRR